MTTPLAARKVTCEYSEIYEFKQDEELGLVKKKEKNLLIEEIQRQS